MQQGKHVKNETNEFLVIEETTVSSDAYTNCCNYLIGKEDESRN